MRIVLFVSLLLTVLVSGLADQPPIRLWVSPQAGLVPLTISAQVMAIRHQDNRKACIWAEDEFLSCWLINGVNDWAIFHPRMFQIRTAGDHEVIAAVFNTRDQIRARTSLLVIVSGQ